MAKGISISIASDTRDFARGVKSGLITPLEDAQHVIGDLAKAGVAGEAKLERAFKGQQAQTEAMRREYQKLTSTVRTETQQQARVVEQHTEEGAHHASETIKEVKSEALQNAAETLSSFQGDASTALAGIQSTFGGLAATLGPIGIGIAAAGAIGFGAIQAQMQKADADAAQVKEDIAAIATELVETGKDAPALDHVVEQLKALAAETDPTKTNLGKLRAVASDAGDSYRNLAQTYAGNTTGLGALIDHERRHLRALQDEIEAQQANTLEGGNRIRSLSAQQDSINTYIGYLQDTKKTVDAAAKAEHDYAAAGGPELAAKSAATQAYADSVQGALEQAGADWTKYQHGQKVNLDKYNDHMEEAIRAQEHYAANVRTATHTLSQDALNYIETLGADAAPLLQQYIDAPNGMKERTASNWDKLGKASSSAYTAALRDGIPDSIAGPRVTLQPLNDRDAADALYAAQRYLDAHPLRAKAVAYTRTGKPLY